MYRPLQPPGHMIEHIFDEEFVLVTSAKTPSRWSGDYVFINWGPDFQQDHAIAFPELTSPGLNLDIGPASMDYLLANDCAGYFPERNF